MNLNLFAPSSLRRIIVILGSQCASIDGSLGVLVFSPLMT